MRTLPIGLKIDYKESAALRGQLFLLNWEAFINGHFSSPLRRVSNLQGGGEEVRYFKLDNDEMMLATQTSVHRFRGKYGDETELTTIIDPRWWARKVRRRI